MIKKNVRKISNYSDIWRWEKINVENSFTYILHADDPNNKNVVSQNFLLVGSYKIIVMSPMINMFAKF